jgi:7-carboxy-7-deazaguanine synthase
MDEIEISEVFYSIQGETSLVGRPAVFVRLSGCNLNCLWCDTAYARGKGKKHKISRILSEVVKYKCPLVVITGGEPLLQMRVNELIGNLISRGHAVVLETNGSREISAVPEMVRIILDIKTPSSGESGSMDFSNIKKLKKKDEIKFVISDRKDFDWSLDILKEYGTDAGEILYSPVEPEMFKELAKWVMADASAARVQANIHKVFSLR